MEKFDGTLKTAMWKYFYSKGTYKWLDMLDDLIYNNNNTKQSTILMKLRNINRLNENVVWNMLFSYNFSEYQMLKFKIGDKLRISKYKSTFTKGYEINLV